MRRLTIAYTVPEPEYKQELEKLLESSSHYMEEYHHLVQEAASLLNTENYEGCINIIAKIRDNLAATDYRLNDVMSLVSGYSQVIKQESVPTNEEIEAGPAQSSDLKDKFAHLKQSVESLGLQVSEEKMKEMLEQVENGTTS